MREYEKWNAFSESYDELVFSLTKYPQRRALITSGIENGVVVNIGTGSTPYLNKDLINNGNVVLACDFCESMLRVAKLRFSHKLLKYILGNSCYLPLNDNSVDNVVSVNSILSPERFQVQQIFNEAYRVLKSGGKLIAFLPSFDCGEQYDLAELGIDVDQEQKREYDTSGWQCYHTPETIEEEVGQAGFTDIQYRRIYMDSLEEIADLKKLYGFDTSNNQIYEYLLIAKK